MNADPTPRRGALAIRYHDEAFTVNVNNPANLLKGRHVAGREFLRALLRFGTHADLYGLVGDPASRQSLASLRATTGAGHGSGPNIHTLEFSRLHSDFLANPPAPVLHFPHPAEVSFAWARQSTQSRFALSGITMTICSEAVARAVCEYVTAPVEEYDSLVCISLAVVSAIRAMAGAYADYLAERFGGRPALRMRLEMIPLGVDVDRFRPATPDERAAARGLIGAGNDEIVILCVGRISLHSKAHPYPLFAGLAEAGRRAGRKIHLVLAGMAPNKPVEDSVRGGASHIAPGIRTTLFAGNRADFDKVWHAADIFTLPSDSIQESQGQAILEGMACGLPVVTTDWDGCRDLVVDGESGILVPTWSARDSMFRATSRLILGEINYDHFLGACNQGVAVDIGRTADAFTRLASDPELRRRMGHAARERAVRNYSWDKIIRRYETLWQAQVESLEQHPRPAPRREIGPACYAAVDHCFAAFPTRWLGDTDRVVAGPVPASELAWLLQSPFTAYRIQPRMTELRELEKVLAMASTPRPLAEIDRALLASGTDKPMARATVGWLLKYGLLRVADEE